MIKQSIEFIKTGIWQIKEEEFKSAWLRWAVRQFKVFTITLRGFGAHALNIRSAALTFYTLMAVVPVAAVVFGVVKAFGVDENFISSLHSSFPEYRTIIDYVLEFADNLIERTKGGWLMAVGSLIFLWAIIRVFNNVEFVFNHVWEVHGKRSITRKLSDYLTIIIIVPLLWVGSNSFGLYLKTTIVHYAGNSFLELLYVIATLLVTWSLFTFIYKMMPNTKVKFWSALNAGIVAGTSFQIFQAAYVYIQGEVSAYNAIYGSFAALPLFLIWLQASWYILLMGAELSYAYQNIRSYEQDHEVQHLNYNSRIKVMVSVMCEVIKYFSQNNGAISPEIIADRLEIPTRLVFDVIFDLEQANLVCAIKDSADDKVSNYLPARDISKITITDVYLSVQQTGHNLCDLGCSQEVECFSEKVDALDEMVKASAENKLLIDLI